jgi:hypothetical protein
MTDRSVKLRRCWWCKHFRLDFGDFGYSEYTPGYPSSADCYAGKGHGIDKNYIFESVKQAETCPDYARDAKR